MFKSIQAAGMVVCMFCCCLMTSSAIAGGRSETAKAQFNTETVRIGSLRLGEAQKDLGAAIPCKPAKGKEQLEGATGDYVETWKYTACGVTLKMSSPSKGGSKTVSGIAITGPSNLRTEKGIHVGSTESEVVKAYGQYRDSESSVAGRTFVAGSVFDGIMFTFKSGRVVEIFLGAAAE